MSKEVPKTLQFVIVSFAIKIENFSHFSQFSLTPAERFIL